jgi:hypothetical protein
MLPYTWRTPLSTPLSAFVDGPLVGGPWGPGDEAPRAVSLEFWERACPPNERHLIYHDDLKGPERGEPGDVVFAHVLAVLQNTSARCVEVDTRPGSTDWGPNAISLKVVATPRFVPLAERFLNSSTSALLRASAVVRGAVTRNEHLFESPRVRRGAARRPPFGSTLAVHIRRGDFEGHCPWAAQVGVTWHSWSVVFDWAGREGG